MGQEFGAPGQGPFGIIFKNKRLWICVSIKRAKMENMKIQ